MIVMDMNLKLPIPAESLVPHRPPFLLVDRLLEFTGQIGVVESVPAPDNLFLDEDGYIEIIAMVEIMAQAAAAVKGYSDIRNGRAIRKGFLVDVREFQFKKRCHEGDIILVRVEIAKCFSGFSIVNGSIVCRGREIAAGALKLWVPDENEE